MTHADSPNSVCLTAPNGEFLMAVRHQVQNLQRRGNIYYWRPRLPARMSHYLGSRHLAFSLKQSDHRRAGYMSRKHNLQTPHVGLSNGTIRRHLGNLEQFLNHFLTSSYALRPFSFKGIKPKKTPVAKVRALTEKPDPEQIAPIFHMPVFTGCAGATVREMAETGPKVDHSSLYFMPMMLTYLGARRAEVAGLNINDILEEDGFWAIKIRENTLRGLKNFQSGRNVPVPDELIRLGFIDYVKRIGELGYKSLFPELVAPNNKTDPGDRFYKSFIPLVRAKTGLREDVCNRILHALRHGFSNTLKQNGVEISIIEDITGHLGRTEGETRYTKIARLGVMKKAINVYPIITRHLEPRPLRLLPYVEANEPAPWFTTRKRRTHRRG